MSDALKDFVRRLPFRLAVALGLLYLLSEFPLGEVQIIYEDF